MSRKKGSKNSLPKGTDWTRRVCTTLIVTTLGPTRSAACTIAVRREFPGSRWAWLSSATATPGRTSPPGEGVRITVAPRMSAPSKRKPNRTPHNQALLDSFRLQRVTLAFNSSNDIQALLGEPPQAGIANPHEIQAVRGGGRRRRSAVARLENLADRFRAPRVLGGANRGR